MKVSLLIAYSLLSTIVSGGGYQECLGRVMAFQAYQIDGFNDVASQTMGFKCKSFDEKANICKGQWDPYKTPPARCNFDEWMHNLGKAPSPKGWAVYQSDKIRLDVEATAKVCYDRFVNGNAKRVPSPRPWKVQKAGLASYNDQIKHISNLVNDAYQSHKTPENQHLWDDYDDAINKILIARAGDHGPYLIEEAKKTFNGIFDIEIRIWANIQPTAVLHGRR